MQLALWIAACAGVALLFRRRPVVPALLVLGLWFTVPAAGSYVLTGQPSGSGALHAATWLVLAAVTVQLIFRPRMLLDVAARHTVTTAVLCVVVIMAGLTTLLNTSGGGVMQLVDQVAVPALLFVLIVGGAAGDPRFVQRMRNGLLVLCAVVCLVALAQWQTGSVLFYEDGYAARYWFDPEGTRWMGTLDQPLTLSMAACVIAPLTVSLRSTWLQMLLLALFGAGVLVSQSRVGVAVMAGVVVFVVLASRKPVILKVLMLAVFGGLASLALYASLAEGLLERLGNDNGSAAARGSAFTSFLASWPDYLLTGLGVNSSYRVAEEANLGTSLESSFLMYAVDLGLVFTLLYFGLMLGLVVRNLWDTFSGGLAVAGLLAVAIPMTYSGLATRSAAATLLWTVVALAVAEGTRRRSLAHARQPVWPHPEALPPALVPVGGKAAG